MEENDAKSTCGGTRLEVKIRKYEKNFDLKSDALLKSLLKSDKTKKIFKI